MKLSESVRARLAAVEMMVFDVDGVLTEGDILYTDQGVELKAFDVKDGLGLRVAGAAGIRLAIMTGRSSRTVERRARDLRIADVVQRVGDKESALRQLAEQREIALERVAFMGDDLNDLEAMRAAGVAIAPGDAVPEIREAADLVTEARGGRGAAREAVEAILRAQGRWDQEVERYLSEIRERDRTPRAAEAK